jgi:hypothetical protein
MVSTSQDCFIKKIVYVLKDYRLVENSISGPVFEPFKNRTQKVSEK